jgi:FkbM family methyltransferase
MDILQKISEIVASSNEPVIFELGMCDAYHSQIMIDILAKSGKRFEFHGFEPVKSLYRNIVLKYDNNFGTVALHNMAIGSKDGLADFYISSGQKIENGQVVANYYGSSSIRAPKLVLEAWKDMKFEQDQISVITLDSYTKGRIVGDKIIDFIWADIQGAEVDMIAGG